MQPHSETTARPARPRKRAAAACYACHARKVRCSIALTGTPCNNCALDSVSCQARPRQNQRARDPPRTPRDEELPTRVSSLDEIVYRPLTEHFGHHSETQATQTTNRQASPAVTGSPLYGDPQGVALVADVCEPERRGKSGHFLVRARRSPSPDPDTLDSLKRRGCFDLPGLAIQQTLVRAYFQYVHPFFPVIDASSFLQAFEIPESDALSPHLLWSMFLAAANFANVETIQAAGFTSRKDMKRSMFARAKALYDADYERSKITLIQAVLLMGFWYSDTEDRLGPWHWNGVAISLSQSIGLHRQPDASLGHSRFGPTIDRNLWRHLWWCCFFRESWLSIGMGRPMRIHLAHCDTPKPDVTDSGGLISGISEPMRRKYLPENTKDLSLLWAELLSLTSILSKVLSVQQLAKRTLHSHQDVDNIESELQAHRRHLDYLKTAAPDPVVTLHMHHFELFFESITLILYRPFIFQNLGDQPTLDYPREPQDWLSSVERKATAAAMNINIVLGSMVTADMIGLSQSLICIALVPALQLHLLHSVSPKDLVHRLGCHHLDLCLMVIEELKVTYFGAEILFRLFTRAREKILSRHLGSETTPLPETNDDGIAVADRGQINSESLTSAIHPAWTPISLSNNDPVANTRYALLRLQNSVVRLLDPSSPAEDKWLRRLQRQIRECRNRLAIKSMHVPGFWFYRWSMDKRKLS